MPDTWREIRSRRSASSRMRCSSLRRAVTSVAHRMAATTRSPSTSGPARTDDQPRTPSGPGGPWISYSSRVRVEKTFSSAEGPLLRQNFPLKNRCRGAVESPPILESHDVGNALSDQLAGCVAQEPMPARIDLEVDPVRARDENPVCGLCDQDAEPLLATAARTNPNVGHATSIPGGPRHTLRWARSTRQGLGRSPLD